MKRPPFKEPMLAAKQAIMEELRFPVLGSPKLDGVRAFVFNGVVYSRKLKPIPNKQVQLLWGKQRFHGFDGELIAGPPTAKDVFRRTTSAVMKANSVDGVRFHLFDSFKNPLHPYSLRKGELLKPSGVGFVLVRQTMCSSIRSVMLAEEAVLEKGYEGLMLRAPDGPYKFGRSTNREGYLMKMKRFLDSEAEVLDCEELEHNLNERDSFGKRTSHKAGKVKGGVLGALTVRDLYTKVVFSIGSGFDDDERAALWRIRKSIIGKIVKYRYFPSGSKTKPRWPTFVGFRSRIDM